MGSLLHCPMQRCEADHRPETTFVVLGGNSQFLIQPFSSMVAHQRLLCMFEPCILGAALKHREAQCYCWGSAGEPGSEGDKSSCAYVFMQPGSYAAASAS